MAFGPLIRVRTETRAVALDVRRGLNLPGEATLALVVPDDDEETKWRTLRALARGWNLASSEAAGRGESVSYVFAVADIYPEGELAAQLRTKDLHLLFAVGADLDYMKVNRVPPVPVNRPQVYELTCTGRMLVYTYFKVAR